MPAVTQQGNAAIDNIDIHPCMQSGPGPLARAMEYTDTMIDRAEDAVNNFIDSATDQAASMMQNVGDGMYNNMPKSLPPNLQPKADMVWDRLP